MTKYLSIIIPSYNRLDELIELLPTLEKQTLDPSRFEVIIVDDGSTDNSESFVEDYIKTTRLKISFYKQQNQGPGKARNLGMEHASGDFYIFLDSDVILPNHWAEAVYNQINAEQLDAFGGPDKAHHSFSALLKAIDYSMTSFITTGGLRGKKGKKLAKFFPRSFNMGLSKAIYDKIGGFGNLRHGQDIEYSNRIIKSGAKVGFIADAYVYHKRRTSLKKFFKHAFNWGVARINLYRLDSSMLEPLHCVPAIATAIFILICLLGLISPVFQFMFQLMMSAMVLVFI
ncbi:MAG: glycosyltransferase, partial [Calditrichaeota bacterium]|nr:glycosyltransferase [Calditrichota bacterium]